MGKLTIEQCTSLEDELTRDAVRYTNLIRSPEQRALAAKDVITSLADKEIRLTYRNGNGVHSELQNLRQELDANRKSDKKYGDLQYTKCRLTILHLVNRTGELRAATGRLRSDMNRLETYLVRQRGTSRAVEARLDERISMAQQHANYTRQLHQEQDNRIKETQNGLESRASKLGTWILAGTLALQSAYIGIELARQPGTYLRRACEAVTSVFE